MTTLIGTSGWSYKEWEGVFYPKGEKRKLTFYSKVFKTVEIDSTFYAYPTAGFALGATRSTPDGFVFSAKLPRLITHEKTLDPDREVRQDLMRFLHLMKPLMDDGKLGALLVQLPPSFSYENGYGKLSSFLDILPPDVKFAVEFRNKSWLGRADAVDLLRSHNVANTTVDEPLLPVDTDVTADFSFVRWHGHGNKPWYNYRYKEKEVEGWAPKVKEVAARVNTVFGYFNNHPHGFAIENSLQLLAKLGDASGPQRAMLADVTSRLDSGRDSRQLGL